MSKVKWQWEFHVQTEETMATQMGAQKWWQTRRTEEEFWKAQSVVETVLRELPDLQIRIVAALKPQPPESPDASESE